LAREKGKKRLLRERRRMERGKKTRKHYRLPHGRGGGSTKPGDESHGQCSF